MILTTYRALLRMTRQRAETVTRLCISNVVNDYTSWTKGRRSGLGKSARQEIGLLECEACVNQVTESLRGRLEPQQSPCQEQRGCLRPLIHKHPAHHKQDWHALFMFGVPLGL